MARDHRGERCLGHCRPGACRCAVGRDRCSMCGIELTGLEDQRCEFCELMVSARNSGGARA